MLSVKRITVTRDDNGAINTQCSGGWGHRAQDFEQSRTSLSCRTHTGHVCAHTRTHTHGMFAHVCASMQTHTHVPCADTYTWMPRHKHTCIHAHNAHVHTHAVCVHRHVHTSNTHARAHTHTHAHTCCACTHSTHSTRTHTAVVFLSISRGSNEPVRNVKSYVITSDSSWQPRRALEGTRSPRPERESAQKHGAHLSSN